MATRLLVLVVLIAATGCNPDRDEQDQSLEHMLDLIIAEREDLEAHRAMRQAEHQATSKMLDKLSPPATPELLAIAGEGATVVEDRMESFYRILTITRPGPRREGLAWLGAAVAKSRSVNVTLFKYSADSWTASVAVLVPMKPMTLGGGGLTPSADESWCYAPCRERRQRIADKNLRLAKLDASLGRLTALAHDKKAVEELMNFDAKFASDAVIPVLKQLEDAGWLPPEGAVSFSPKELVIAAPAQSAAGCVAMFKGCTHDPAHSSLLISL